MRMKSWLMTLLVLTSGSLLLEGVVMPVAMMQAQTVEARETEADKLLEQGNQQYQASQFEAALLSWQQALVIYHEIKNRLGEGYALNNLGSIYYSLGNYELAIEYRERSLAIKHEIKDRPGEIHALGNLGLAHLSLGNYIKAIDYQNQGILIARDIQDRASEGSLMKDLGTTYQAAGKYATAIEYQGQSLKISHEIKDQLLESQSLGNLGSIYQNIGDYLKALNYTNQSLEISRKIKDRLGEAQSLGVLAGIYEVFGKYSEAIDNNQKSLNISREIRNQHGEATILRNLGNNYRATDDYINAIKYGEQSLALSHEIKDRQVESSALAALGATYGFLGNYSKAINYSKRSLDLAREIKDPSTEGSALNNLGTAFFKSGNLNTAEKMLFECLTVLESFQKIGVGNNDSNKVSIFEQQARTYRGLQQILIAKNKPTVALEVSDRGRSRALVDLLKQKLAPDSKPNETDNSRYSSATQIQQTAKTQNAILVEYSIIYDEFKVNGKQETKESALYIWVITPNGTITFRQVDLKPLWQTQHTQLADLVTTSRSAIGVRSRKNDFVPETAPLLNPTDQKRNLQQLHKLLIEPIADLLPKDPNDQVIFIPQGELFLVPFPALQAGWFHTTEDKYWAEYRPFGGKKMRMD
jgi:tetratricopeptide (TPR) repeat protein